MTRVNDNIYQERAYNILLKLDDISGKYICIGVRDPQMGVRTDLTTEELEFCDKYNIKCNEHK